MPAWWSRVIHTAKGTTIWAGIVMPSIGIALYVLACDVSLLGVQAVCARACAHAPSPCAVRRSALDRC